MATTFIWINLWYNLATMKSQILSGTKSFSRPIGRKFPGGIVYHVLNRANARVPIFMSEEDYVTFEHTLYEAWEQSGMPILSYEIMPNHWHLSLYPQEQDFVSDFMEWLTNTHVKRWQAAHDTVGMGHLYQNSYKAFAVSTDRYCLNMLRYIESNALRAGLVKHAEDWRWGSLWIRLKGTPKQRKMLASWPVDCPDNYLDFVNEPVPKDTLEVIRGSAERGKPFGSDEWTNKTAEILGITLRNRGRPRKQD